jgi:hypothetical protein
MQRKSMRRQGFGLNQKSGPARSTSYLPHNVNAHKLAESDTK